MAVRKKGRSIFSHSRREFAWWVDNDTFIRIASSDKSFVVAYLLYDVPSDVAGILGVHGHEFSGISREESRPVWLAVPDTVANTLQDSMGSLVDALITWCLDPDHELVRYDYEAGNNL